MVVDEAATDRGGNESYRDDLVVVASNLKLPNCKAAPTLNHTMLTRPQFDAACKQFIAKYAASANDLSVTDALKSWVWNEHPVRQ